MVELLSAELIELIQEDPQHAVEVADEHLASMLEEKPLYPGGGYSESYLAAARQINSAVHEVAEVPVESAEGAKGTVYEASEPVSQG